MYVVEAAPECGSDVARGLRAGLEEIGESVVVVGGNGLWQVHVHTDDPAAALAAFQSAISRFGPRPRALWSAALAEA